MYHWVRVIIPSTYARVFTRIRSVEPPNPRKKKPLTEIEIALKREETARKRRNLTEKKLEDEKVRCAVRMRIPLLNLLMQVETINRLLKKQSRTRGRRNALSTAEDKPTPGENAPGEGEEEDVAETFAPPPTMYRWVSRVQPIPAPGEDGEQQESTEKTVVFSFSVPIEALPPTVAQDGDGSMQVDGVAAAVPKPPPSTPPHCDVQGCTALRKYRLVRDFHKGACGLSHLKVLEGQMV